MTRVPENNPIMTTRDTLHRLRTSRRAPGAYLSRQWKSLQLAARAMRAPVAALLVAVTPVACAPTSLLATMAPDAPGGETRAVAYGPNPRHRMDIYAPAPNTTPAPASASPSAPPFAPVVVFFYGGGWRSGDRAMYRFVGRTLAACGVLAVIPDYRVWPEVGFPDFLEDAAAAVAQARRIAPSMGGDPARLFLMGHSAGAYIAAMLALDPTWLAREGMNARTALAGVVGIAGPYDFLPLRDPVLRQIFAGDDPRTQPISFAGNAAAPLLLLTGAADTTVEPANSLRLADRVRAAGGAARTIVYPGLSHVSVLGAMSGPLHFLGSVRDDTCRFLVGQDPAT